LGAINPIDRTELEFNHGTFDTAEFYARALASPQSLAAVIDSALLSPGATRDKVEKLCSDAVQFRFASALVQPIWVPTAVGVLAGTGIPVGVVLGFPLGASLTSTLRHEAAALLRLGARELDMVAPIGQLKSGNRHAVDHAVRTVASVAHHHGAILKVILETSLLTVQEKLAIAELAIQAGADFIKTSTGFGACGDTVADVAVMRGVAGARCGVCAAGGIRTLAAVKSMIEAGADRIGSSASVAIMREFEAE
jgi:deoxyribose-phosphate aldolase